jgi:hypothetical protein
VSDSKMTMTMPSNIAISETTLQALHGLCLSV